MKGNNGHLSYGRASEPRQWHVVRPVDRLSSRRTRRAPELLPFLPRFQQRDVSLDTDDAVRRLLKRASDDIVVRQTQDQFFSDRFLTPALPAAQRRITRPLGRAVVYDGHIQRRMGPVQPKVGAIGAGARRTVVDQDLHRRPAEVAAVARPSAAATVSRMQAFTDLIEASNWFLELPCIGHGVTVAKKILVCPTARLPVPTLRLTTPSHAERRRSGVAASARACA